MTTLLSICRTWTPAVSPVNLPILTSGVVKRPQIACQLTSTPTQILLTSSVLQSRSWRYPLAVIPLSRVVLVAVPSAPKSASAPLIVPAHPGDLGNSLVFGKMRVDAHTAPIPVTRRSGRRESFCIIQELEREDTYWQFTVPSDMNPVIHLPAPQLCPAFTFTNSLSLFQLSFVAFLTVPVVSVSQFPDARIRLRISPNIPPFAA